MADMKITKYVQENCHDKEFGCMLSEAAREKLEVDERIGPPTVCQDHGLAQRHRLSAPLLYVHDGCSGTYSRNQRDCEYSNG